MTQQPPPGKVMITRCYQCQLLPVPGRSSPETKESVHQLVMQHGAVPIVEMLQAWGVCIVHHSVAEGWATPTVGLGEMFRTEQRQGLVK